MKDCAWDSRPKYEKLIEPLRAKARELGYALAVHGTLKRDIDIVAIPWIELAEEPKALAMALNEVVVRILGRSFLQDDPLHMEGCPGHKPHGRLAWCFYFAEVNGHPSAHEGYIDLAVMPKKPGATFVWGS